VRLALLALVSLAFGVHSAPAAASCSFVEVGKALHASGIGLERGPDKLLCWDYTHDGRVDMAVTIYSGGTAGDVRFAVFRATPSGWRLALTRRGYKLGLFRVASDLVWSQPVYRKGDANCCPTGGFDHARWHWNGSRFVVVRSWRDRRFTP
jgi:hypothetical protein